MNDGIAATIIVLLFLLGATLMVTLRWPRSGHIGLVDVLVFLAGGALIVLGIVLCSSEVIVKSSDLVPLVLIGLLFIVGVGGIVYVFVYIMAATFWLPDPSRVVHNGWIKVRPQLIVRRKINKAIVDHARAITKMNLPLAQGFAISADQSSGRVGLVLQAMASFLQHGLKLSEAYSRYAARSALILSMMRAGERSGQLPEALGYMQDYLHRELQRRRQWIPAWWPYPILLLIVTFFMWLFCMVVVVPKFEQIFRDFGTTLPWTTQLMIRLANFVVLNGHILFLVAAFIGVIYFLRLQPRRFPKPRFYHRIADRVVWVLPGLGSQQLYTNLAHAAAVLRFCLGSGMGVNEAVQTVTELDLNLIMRQRFQRFYERLQQGEPVDQAGAKEHLPPRLLWALRAGQDRQTLGTSLELIERYYGLVASHWYMAVSSVIWPLVVVGMGMVVGFYALAFFSPLVKLIEATAGAR